MSLMLISHCVYIYHPSPIPDVNECDDGNGGCESSCDNTDGSFVCSCNIGYIVYSNKFCSGKWFDVDNCNYEGFVLVTFLIQSIFKCIFGLNTKVE